MDAQGLPIVSPNIDYRQVEKISSQRLLCFVNHFVAHTVDFLNSFADSCERRLSEVNWRIQRTEATLSVLEAKLSSIPGLDAVTLTPKASASTSLSELIPKSDLTTEKSQSDLHRSVEVIDPDASVPVTEADTISSDDLVRAKDHPAFAKFFRMIYLGVPLMAVVNKCRAENLDLDVELLKTPDRLVPIGGSMDQGSDVDDEGWSQ